MKKLIFFFNLLKFCRFCADTLYCQNFCSALRQVTSIFFIWHTKINFSINKLTRHNNPHKLTAVLNSYLLKQNCTGFRNYFHGLHIPCRIHPFPQVDKQIAHPRSWNRQMYIVIVHYNPSVRMRQVERGSRPSKKILDGLTQAHCDTTVIPMPQSRNYSQFLLKRLSDNFFRSVRITT